jgi:hypothetical protein
MANTKRIIIEGDMPYDCGQSRLWTSTASQPEEDAAKHIQSMLAYMAGPVTGVRIGWTKHSVRRTATSQGGMLSHYGYCISGTDSLSRKWVDQWMVATLLIGGRVNYVHVKDIDAPELIYDIGERNAYGKAADPALRLWIAGLMAKEYPGTEISI